MEGRHHMKDATNMTAKLKASHHKWNFNKLEAAHATNHMKDATNIALHILKVSRHKCHFNKLVVQARKECEM